jgi:tetratricopeptide (TPR) repeat protein
VRDRILKTKGLWVLLFLLCVSSPARAQSVTASEAAPDPCLADEKCSQLCEQARILSQAGQPEGALFAYQLAFGLHPQRWLLINIGRMQQKSGRTAQAISTFKYFLETTAPREDAAAVSQELIEQRVKVRQYLLEAETQMDEALKVEEPPPASLVLPRPAPPPRPVPLHRRWWFGTSIGATAALILVVTAAGVATSRGPVVPSTDGLTVLMATF